MHSERATMAMAGMATVNSGAHPPDLTSGLCRAGTARQTACPRITRLQRANPTASQKGKNPPSGPLIPQPMFSASDSQATSPASTNKPSAHTISAWRISLSFASPHLRLLLQQPAFGHEVSVQSFGRRKPGAQVRTAQKSLFQAAFVREFLPFWCLGDFLQDLHVPLLRFLRDTWRAKNATQHEVLNVIPLLFHGRNSLPLRQVQPLCIKEPQRPQPPGLPVPHRLVGIVDGGVDMLADQVDGHIATTLEGDVNEFRPCRLLELNSDDLVLLRCACPPHLKLAGIFLDGL